jgi:hypothetical protein
MLAVLVGNSAGILVENRDYMFGERTLAAVATSSEETIYTDPMTYHRAKLLLRWADAEDRVVAAPPPPGACFLYNSLRAGTPNRFVSPDRVIEYQPQPSWSVMQHWDPGLKWSGSILRMIGIEGMLSEHLREMLMSGHAGVVLYRAAASGEKPPQ